MSEIKFEGLDELIKTIDELADDDKIREAIGKACAVVERTAKQKAPKGNGELRRSITSKVENLEGIVFTPLEYAPYVEYGTGLFAENGGRQDVPWHYKDEKGEWHTTSGQSPHPYMRPALENNREQIVKTIKESLLND